MKSSLLVLVALAFGCGPNISTIRMGSFSPPRADDCRVAFENLDYLHAAAAYDQVGVITVAGGDVTDKVRDQVRQKACRMGADAVALSAAVESGVGTAGHVTQFMVLKKRAPQADTAAAPTQSGI
jgi:hypothetical protein